MTPQIETLETAGQGLDEARIRIAATLESLQAVLDRDLDVPEFRQAIGRLERLEAELERIDLRIENRAKMAS